MRACWIALKVAKEPRLIGSYGVNRALPISEFRLLLLLDQDHAIVPGKIELLAASHRLQSRERHEHALQARLATGRSAR